LSFSICRGTEGELCSSYRRRSESELLRRHPEMRNTPPMSHPYDPSQPANPGQPPQGRSDRPQKSRSPWIFGGVAVVVIAIVAAVLIVFVNKGDSSNGAPGSPQAASGSSDGNTPGSAGSSSKSPGGQSPGGGGGAATADLQGAKSSGEHFLYLVATGDMKGAKFYVCPKDADTFQQDAGNGKFASAKGNAYTVTDATATSAKTAKVSYSTPGGKTGTLAMSTSGGPWSVCPSDQVGVQDLVW
jgi:hypothetical protein